MTQLRQPVRADRRLIILLGAVALVAALALIQREALGEWWGRNGLVLRQSLVSGLLIGGVYSLVAMGLTLIFGVLGIINFAHGALMAAGMYITAFAFNQLGIDPYLSLLLTVPACFALGALIERLIISRAMGAPEHNQLLLTLGVALLLENFYLVAFSADPLSARTEYSGARFFIGDTMVSAPRLTAFLLGLLVGLGLYLLLARTRLGRMIRAAAQDRDGAALSGVNVGLINTITFGLGTAVAGAAGSLIMPFFTVRPTAGEIFNITAFVVVVLGGMGNVPGALIGGLIIGLTEALGAVFLPGSTKQLGVFLIFILLLLFRPNGILGGRAAR